MTKKPLLILSVGITAMATEFPPSIPEGQVSYDEVSYQNPSDSLPADFATPAPTARYTAPAIPVTPPASTPNTIINLNAYTTNYEVRGMGFTNGMTNYGYSSLGISHTFANRNLFNKGIHHRVHGMAGAIWDAASPLGDIAHARFGYSIGKEIFPNLILEVGYNFRRGGFEGYMAKYFDRCSHRSEQDFTVTLSYNDHQKGFFGHAEWGYAFYGLTGSYVDTELGYRFTDLFRVANVSSDVEISGGVAPSFSYWGSGIEGIDAYRVKLAFAPHTDGGLLSRDGHMMIKPWVQCSWTGDNCRKISNRTNSIPVDHFQITFGVDVGWKF